MPEATAGVIFVGGTRVIVRLYANNNSEMGFDATATPTRLMELQYRVVPWDADLGALLQVDSATYLGE
jgi:hypothetical protein